MTAMTVTAAPTTWTPERVALLKERIEAGLSSAQIARELGVSRNAVIGKANRLRLSRFKRATAGQPDENGPRTNARPRIATRHRTLRALWAKPQPASAAEVPVECARRCSLLELAPWHCRWPMGDPSAQGFGFCGNKPVDGLPYCPGHARMAYRPGSRAPAVRELHRLAQAG
jgi:GcrA cell cycle regulator